MTEPTLAQLERIDLAQKLQTIGEAKNLETTEQLLAKGYSREEIPGLQLAAIMQGNNVHYDPNDPTKSKRRAQSLLRRMKHPVQCASLIGTLHCG